MENFSILTSQNISIEQPLASVGERIAAAAVDFLIFFGYFILLSFISVISGNKAVMIALAIPVVFYHLVCEWAMNGQSFGKKVLKIKVIKLDGAQLGFLSFFLRWIFRLIDITFLFGSIATLSIIINSKNQRIGDIAAGTSVVRLKNGKISDTLFSRLPVDYQMVYPQVSKLTESDLYTIKEVMDFLKSSNKTGESMLLADKTKYALEKKMGVNAQHRSEHFLYHILRDYNYLNSRQ